MAKHDIIVIGAGIVGLATTYYLRRTRPDLDIMVIEKENAPGLHQTGHNSGVIHAGIYYAPGSLKARLCKAGAEQTKGFCEENDIPFDECGKLIVATDEGELAALDNLRKRAETNGLGIRIIEAAEMAEIEPNINGVRAILSPASGIVDYGRICRVLRDRLAADGVEFHFGTQVSGIRERADAVTVQTTSGDFSASTLVACAGLQADRLADMSGLADDFRIIPFRGEYFRLSEQAGNLVSHLIYPVPDPSLPFLGVHLTKMIGGYTTVGPNAVFSFGRETYKGNGLDLADAMRSAAFPGFWKLMARSVRPGIHELRGTLSRRVYLERCRRYCPALTLADLQPYEPGIRAQAVDRHGKMIDDFLLRQTARTIHVCNAPSPAATSAFPIGAEIGSKILEKISV
ncbi:L-2-hydroxyglutarate oxidase [Falsochrobactrum shanghaiense]|uniref:L-2-hydroxyglutarate oxidase n=1 Tax=Falsochrobactrum shanghaiense TaxID=2201899 RepID=A0A316JAS7_9HYPH|nr:L-2-hydroxyglutarate oxidase [Falsochrobactrum shanghaiense]PWL18574.1 L-2-hydroxyglutarate oxidase [Falsochrobactrum shanghaiense]